MPKPITTLAAVGLPALSTLAADLGLACDRLEEIARRYDAEALADRLWVGVCCLAAREIHSLDASQKGKLGGRGNKSLSRRDKLSELSPDDPSPQGYLGWITTVAPWLNRATTYKYSDAATGAGFTAWTTEAEVRAWVREALAGEAVTLAGLVADGRKMLGMKPAAAPPRPTFEQMTFDSILGFAAQSEQVLGCRQYMTPKQCRLAAAHAYRTLRELTGSPWGPSDHDDKEMLSALKESAAGGI